MLSKTLQLGAAGSGAAEGTYVEDVFSTWLYDGDTTSRTITNGIDISTEGGLIWFKDRDTANPHWLFDTERGTNYGLRTDSTNAQSDRGSALTSFNTDGFTIGSGDAGFNSSGIASWTFRKAPGFFDVVTYTGNNYVAQNISHNLGCVPGCIIIKCTSSTGTNWRVYHRSTGAGVGLQLDSTDAGVSSSAFWNNTAPTSTEFTVGSIGDVNGTTSQTYVAYLFAHDEPIFGADADQSIVKCGSYTHGSGVTEVNVGFEPQWLLIKRTDTSQSWFMFDNMRGWTADANRDAQYVSPNNSVAEAGIGLGVFANGFRQDASVWGSGGNYIYIAIRRGPMKVPEDATTVFATDTSEGTSPSPPQFTAGFPADAVIRRKVDSAGSNLLSSRLQGTRFMYTNLTDIEDTASLLTWDYMDGWAKSTGVDAYNRAWMFRRAPGFFDVVAYTGTGSNRTVDHNLGVAPELIICKLRNDVNNWPVYNSASGATKYMQLNSSNGVNTSSLWWNNTEPTDSVFTVGTDNEVNKNGYNFIAYLFASCPGVSKVGSYTGTGSNLSVNCGFAGGARFVLIKRTDSTGDWWVFDTARGIVSSGIDPALRLNLTNAEVTSTDYLEPNSNGFTVTSTAGAGLNANGGSYIYLAIA